MRRRYQNGHNVSVTRNNHWVMRGITPVWAVALPSGPRIPVVTMARTLWVVIRQDWSSPANGVGGVVVCRLGFY